MSNYALACTGLVPAAWLLRYTGAATPKSRSLSAPLVYGCMRNV